MKGRSVARERSHNQQLKGLAMMTKLAETQLWQQNLASLIRSGLFSRAETGSCTVFLPWLGFTATRRVRRPWPSTPTLAGLWMRRTWSTN